MSDPIPSSRRQFFRSPVSAKTKVRLVDETQRHHIRKCFDIKMLTDAYPEADSSMTQLLSLFMDMFNHIDEKLDRICDQLEKDEPVNRSLDVVDTVDISASGVNVLLRERIEVGRMVHLSMSFSGSYRGSIEVLGRVARSSSPENGEKDVYNTGIEFVDLCESEKDLLVKYTFSQQRKQIRTAGDTNM